MKQEYKMAFSEVNNIIKTMPEELVKKIPKSFREVLIEETDKSYNPDIQEPLEKVKLKNETVIILGLIYRDFLCSSEERKRLQEKDAKELQKAQLELKNEIRERYNPDNLFKKDKKIENEVTKSNVKETSLAEIEKQGFMKSLLSILKKIFFFSKK